MPATTTNEKPKMPVFGQDPDMILEVARHCHAWVPGSRILQHVCKGGDRKDWESSRHYLHKVARLETHILLRIQRALL